MDSKVLNEHLKGVTDAIRAKEGSSDLINPQDFSTRIANLSGGGSGFSEDTDTITPNGWYWEVDFNILQTLEDIGGFLSAYFSTAGGGIIYRAITTMNAEFNPTLAYTAIGRSMENGMPQKIQYICEGTYSAHPFTSVYEACCKMIGEVTRDEFVSMMSEQGLISITKERWDELSANAE